MNFPYLGSNFRGETEVNVADVLDIYHLHDVQVSKQSVALLYYGMEIQISDNTNTGQKRQRIRKTRGIKKFFFFLNLHHTGTF